MEVYLVRHAVAEGRDASRWTDDAQRPLTKAGQRRFAQIAQHLQTIIPHVDRVLTSPYVRAQQTALILQSEAGWPEPELCDALGASAGVAPALAVLREQTDVATVALVGHEPNLSMLAAQLLTGNSNALDIELKKGGIICLSFSSTPDVACAQLRWSAGPKLLSASDRSD